MKEPVTRFPPVGGGALFHPVIAVTAPSLLTLCNPYLMTAVTGMMALFNIFYSPHPGVRGGLLPERKILPPYVEPRHPRHPRHF